jgi:hypothetical protein
VLAASLPLVRLLAALKALLLFARNDGRFHWICLAALYITFSGLELQTRSVPTMSNDVNVSEFTFHGIVKNNNATNFILNLFKTKMIH